MKLQTLLEIFVAAFCLLLQNSGFRLLVLLFWLLHSERLLADSLVDSKRRLVDSHVLDDYLMFMDPV